MAIEGFGPELRTKGGRLIIGRIAEDVLAALRAVDADNTPIDPRRMTDLVKGWLTEKGNGPAVSETALAAE